jgi:hypothetical protein
MAYGLQLLTPPPGPAVSLVQARRWARVDSDDTTQDPVLLGLIQAATEMAQNFTGRQLVSAKYKMFLPSFPGFWGSQALGSWSWGSSGWYGSPGPTQGAGQWNWQWWLGSQYLRIPRPPLQADTSADVPIEYTDPSGDNQTLDTDTYQVSEFREPALVSPVYGSIWPYTQAFPDAVRVTFHCGYGPVTSIAASITAGAATVTPASMFGIFPGTVLVIDPDVATRQESVRVTATTASTFTATFVKDHPANTPVGPSIPASIWTAMQLMVQDWYVNRGETWAPGDNLLSPAVRGLLWNEWTGMIPYTQEMSSGW